jgi:outer membrane protein, heavy metal efflux system
MAHAEEVTPLTLSAAITEAQEKNPEIRALSAAIASARGDVMTAKTWDNPEVNVAPGIRQSQPSGGPNTTEFHGIFELHQTIEFPGKRALRRALAEKGVEVQELALTGFRNQLTTEVRHAYYALLVSQQVLALKRQELALAQTFADAARRKVEAGFAPEFEATTAEVQVIGAQKALRETQAKVATTRAALNTLLGRAPRAALEITGVLTAEVVFPNETNLVQQVFTRNPSLRVQAAQVERAGLSLQSARKSRFPDVTVGPSVEYLKDEQTYDFGITLPLPLWDSKKGEIVTAQAEQEKAQAEADKLKQEISRDVTSAYQDLESANESLALFTPGLFTKLKNALDAAAQSYADGRTSLLVYLETQRTYYDTQADYFDALQKVYDAQAALESAAGAPLSQFEENAK